MTRLLRTLTNRLYASCLNPKVSDAAQRTGDAPRHADASTSFEVRFRDSDGSLCDLEEAHRRYGLGMLGEAQCRQIEAHLARPSMRRDRNHWEALTDAVEDEICAWLLEHRPETVRWMLNTHPETAERKE